MRTPLALLLLLLTVPLRAETSTWLDVARENIGGPGAVSEEGSYETFTQELTSRQSRAARRDWEARPAPGTLDSGAVDKWFAASIAGHRAALVDALAASAVDRCGIKSFGIESSGLLRQPENWSAGTLAPAALVGGVYAYFAGVRTSFDTGSYKVGLDLTPLKALAHGPDSRRLARLELAQRGRPLSLYAEWGPAQAADRVGANWSARF